MDSFGNRLMLARAHAGHISIREAADLCDIGRGAWTNWEKGARPSDIIEIAAVVADKLGVDRDWLLFGGSLGQSEPRSLRRTIRRSDTDGSNGRSARPALSARRHSAERRGDGPTGQSVSPMRRGRRDSIGPVSPVPPNRRRPTQVG